jgi:hypothetical protein
MHARSLTFFALVVSSSLVAADQAPLSRLRYTPPEQWQRSIDGDTRLASLTPPGGGAAVTFAESEEFQGSAQAWQEKLWTQFLEEMKPATQALDGKQGEFFTRMAAFQRKGGSPLWVCLYSLVKDGRGEAAVFLAEGEKPYFAYLATVNSMIYGVTLGTLAEEASASLAVASGAQPSSSQPPSPASAAPPDAGKPPALEFEMARDFSMRVDSRTYQANYGTIRFYDFRPYRGNLEDEFSKTLLGDWIAPETREQRLRAQPAIQRFAIPGAEKVLAARFQEDYWGTARERMRVAIQASGSVAIVDINVNDTGSWDYYQPGITAFLNSLKIATPSTPVSATDFAAELSALPMLEYQISPDFSFDGRSGLGTYHSRKGDGAIQIYDFRAYSGNFEQEFRNTLLRDLIARDNREEKLASTPVIQASTMPGAEKVLSARFLQDYWGTPRDRYRLAILASGAVAIVDINLHDADAAQRYQGGIIAMFNSLKIAPPQPVTPPGPNGYDIAGLWLASKMLFNPNLSGGVGSGSFQAGTEFYLLSPDGRAYRGRKLPQTSGGDIRRFDYDAAQREDPQNYGRYFLRGATFIIRFGPPPQETITVNRTGADACEIYGVAFKRDVK